jgi:hypothetical protein
MKAAQISIWISHAQEILRDAQDFGRGSGSPTKCIEYKPRRSHGTVLCYLSG